MALQEKYAPLVAAAQEAGVANLQVREQDNILYIDGDAASAEIKEALWQKYDEIDPEYRSGDLVLNINAPEAAEYVVKPGDNLSKIGAKLGKNWRDIYEANKDIIGSNPDHIQVGWKLKV